MLLLKVPFEIKNFRKDKRLVKNKEEVPKAT